jgi:predicted nucleic acid-binding Zn ribbon protein
MNEDGYTLAELINEFYKRHNRENSLDEMKIIESWKSVVGGFIASHTLDLRITKGILYVKVDADSLRSELMYSKTILLRNINRVSGTDLLKDIVII